MSMAGAHEPVTGAGNPVGEPRLESVQVIWQGAPHNAFTTLTFFNGRWLCAFREGTSHFSMDGNVRVISSEDGKNWENVLLFRRRGFDYRDPKFTVTPANKLMLLIGCQYPDSVSGKGIYGSVVSFSEDGIRWQEEQMTNIIAEWAYDICWKDKYAYTATYNRNGKVKLYRSKNGVKYSLVTMLDLPGGTNEIALGLDNMGNLKMIARCDSGFSCYLGVGNKPFKKWSYSKMPFFMAGVKMLVLQDSTILAGGRAFTGASPYTILARSVKGKDFTNILTLPSQGDSSYPGMVWKDNVLWISYYSSHDGSAKIYLARVSFAKPTQPGID